MIIDVLTLFPEMFTGVITSSILKRAITDGKVTINIHNFREFSKDIHHKVDDTPYGGGCGMILACQPIFDCVNSLRRENSKVIFEIVNEGRTPVYDVVPAVEEVTGMKHIFISPSVLVEQIAPGEGIRYTATVSAGEKLKDGEVVLRVTVAAGDNAECDWQEFSLPTQKRIR